MASLAEKREADAEERSLDPQARPEELRLLSALSNEISAWRELRELVPPGTWSRRSQ